MKRIRHSLTVALVALALLAGFVLALVVAPLWSGGVASAIDDPIEPQISGSDLLNEQQRVFAEIYDLVSPSVVSITIGEQTGQDGPFQPVSSGSGFVIDMQGHIVTNYHVVADADRIEIAMFDGTITEAVLVGSDPDSDLAVIRINVESDRLRPVRFADSDQLQIGQTTLAIGSPFQNDWTLTSGIISALNRRIRGLSIYSIGGVIQTDAAINPGNSGGPLLNLDGEVIGVNSQIESNSRSNSGVGFAVPSNLVVKVSNALIASGRMDYSYIGISSLDINLDVIEDFNLPNNIRGVAVRRVQPSTPAAAAGLQSMSRESVDVITAINGRPLANFDEMIGYLAVHTNPGETVTLTVYRSGQILQLPLTLTSRPGS